MKKLNGKPSDAANPAKKLSNDDLLYRTVEQLAQIADSAKLLSEFYIRNSQEHGKAENDNQPKPFTDEEAFKIGQLIEGIHKGTRGMNTLAILSRLVVTLTAVAQSKTLLAATLTVSKKDKVVHLKGHYGNGAEDFHDLQMNVGTAQQLCDGLAQAVEIIEGKKSKIILPDSGLIIN